MKDIDKIIAPRLDSQEMLEMLSRENCDAKCLNRLINERKEDRKIRGQIDMSIIMSEPLWIIGVTRVWCHPRLRLYMIGNKLSAALSTAEPHRWSIDSAFGSHFASSLLFAGDAREREKAREIAGELVKCAIIHPYNYPSWIDFAIQVPINFIRYFILMSGKTLRIYL